MSYIKVPFDQLQPGTSFYQGEDVNGGIKILKSEPIHDSPVNGEILVRQTSLVALALNQLCREQGAGKIYVYIQRKPVSQGVTAARYEASRSVPDLIYKGGAWTASEKRYWDSLTPREQLSSIQATSNISDNDSIVEICLECSEEQSNEVYLNAFSKAYATILIAPEAYIGETQAMHQLLDPFKRFVVPGVPDLLYRGYKHDIDEFRVAYRGGSARGIVKWLEDRYTTGEGVRLFRDTLDRASRAAKAIRAQEQSRGF